MIDPLNLLPIGSRVSLHLAGFGFAGEIEKVSYTAEHAWYGVKLDDGTRLHGVEPTHLKPA